MPTRPTSALLLVAATLAALPGVPGLPASWGRRAAAQELVLGDDGRLESGRLVAIDDRFVVWRDPSGEIRQMPLASCIAVSVENPLPIVSPDAGVMELADGQVFPGRIGLNNGRLTWRHALVGETPIDIERLRSLQLLAGVKVPVARDADVVVLANGDRVEGVVTSLGTAIEVEPLTGGVAGQKPEPIAIPLERVAALSLVTPQVRLAGAVVWFADGTVIEAESPRLGDDGLVRLRPAFVDAGGAGSLSVPMEQVSGIVFRAEAIQPLADLDPVSVEGPVERFRVPAPRADDRGPASFGVSPIWMSGPIVVRYVLPEPGMRFLARAVLPRKDRGWGDLEIVVRDGARELLRSRLDAQHPAVAIDLPISGTDLTIELLEGRNGPVQDTVLLLRPLLIPNRQA
ncbi:MAG: hypothetical protein KDA22_02170 [Phycisphaerales bacterium]|nr:hypothetical protein [Phycisphaerales bacterium]